MDQPPVDTNEPSIRHLVSQLIDDTAGYARAEAEFFRAELGDRGRHLAPAIYLFIAAAIAGFALIITVIVVASCAVPHAMFVKLAVFGFRFQRLLACNKVLDAVFQAADEE